MGPVLGQAATAALTPLRAEAGRVDLGLRRAAWTGRRGGGGPEAEQDGKRPTMEPEHLAIASSLPP